MLLLQPYHPYQEGSYKDISVSSKSKGPADEYEQMALAKRLNITLDDMKQMSYVSFINILLSSVEEDTSAATQQDIDKTFG